MSALVYTVAAMVAAAVGMYVLIFIALGVAIWCETHAPRDFSLTGWMERFWEKRFGG